MPPALFALVGETRPAGAVGDDMVVVFRGGRDGGGMCAPRRPPFSTLMPEALDTPGGPGSLMLYWSAVIEKFYRQIGCELKVDYPNCRGRAGGYEMGKSKLKIGERSGWECISMILR